MMAADLRATEAAVLATYKRENPSTHFLAESDQAFAERAAQRAALYRDQLKFPPEMFAGTRLLDLGAGTGENSVFYARWGAACTLVEINDEALERARRVFGQWLDAPEAHAFVQASLFDFETEARFDRVVCEGVIHHTANKAAAFARLAGFLAPGGYLVLSVGNAAGCFQRALQRMTLFAFAENEEEIVEAAERLFKEHLDRASRFGQRTRRAVIFDSFVNPKVDFPSVAQVLRWFADQGLRLYSAWPPITPALLGDSGMRSTFDPLALPDLAAAAELPARLEGLGTLAERQARLTDSVNDFAPGQAFSGQDFKALLAGYRGALEDLDFYAGFREKSVALIGEVETLVGLIERGDIAAIETFLASTRHLFRGTGGLGISRFVGYRPDT